MAVTVNCQEVCAERGCLFSAERISGRSATAARMSVKCAVIVLVSLPMLLIYPFLQKYFVKGVIMGSVKG